MVGADVAAALIDFARSENATQVVLGASQRSRWEELTQGSVINRVIRLSGSIDVHVISSARDDGDGDERARRLPAASLVLSPLPPRRQAWGWAAGATGLPLLTVVLANTRSHVALPSVLLLYLLVGMGVAVVGGLFPSLAAVVAGFLLAHWYFTPPLYHWTIAEAENLLALLVYLVAAGMVSVLVDRLGRSRLTAERARAETEAMAALAGSLADRVGSGRGARAQRRQTRSAAAVAA